MIGRALYLFVAGAIGGLVAWMITEPFAPRFMSDVAWARFEQNFGLAAGLMIGFLVGAASGYNQGSRAHLMRGAAIGAVVGAIAGPLGVSLGSAVYNFIVGPTRGLMGVGWVLEWVGRATGWALFGMMIGMAEGALGASTRRAFLGALGGFIGGAIGGFVFQLSANLVGNATAAIEGGSEIGMIPRALGLVAVGGGIGLFIGIIEALGRQAWVRQLVGRNEGREWMIDAPQTVLGRAENAQVPLLGDPNVSPNHAVIVRQSGRYLLVDQGTPLGTGLNGIRLIGPMMLASGDMIQVGSHNLQFLLKGGAARRAAAERQAHAMGQPVAMAGGAPVGAGVGFAPLPGSSQPTVAFGGPAGSPPFTGAPTMAFPAGTPGQASGPVGAVGSVLVALGGPMAGQRIPVGTPLEIGREGSGLALGFDAMASRRHARIEPAPGGLSVTDLGSTNGTFINGQRVPTGLLRPGDTVRIGSTEFRYES